MFLEELSGHFCRAKGVSWINGTDQKYVFLLVGQRCALDKMSRLGPVTTRLVLIGRNLDHRAMRDKLEGCLG